MTVDDRTILTDLEARIRNGTISWPEIGAIRPAVASAVRLWTPAPLSPLQEENLSALQSGAAAAVLTGQQPGLLLGPLFTLAKGATAVRLARAMQQRTGRRVVPVFWIHGEDHDLAEINRYAYVDADGALHEGRLEFGGLEHQARSLFDVPLPGDPLPALDGDLDAGTLSARIRRAYRPGRSVVEAFAEALQAVFGDAGLLLFAVRSPGVPELLTERYRTALLEHDAIAAELEARTAELAGGQSEHLVRIRPDSPLFFLHGPHADSGRARLTKVPGAADRWMHPPEPDPLSTDELSQLIDREPERFSSSALLRPILQDTLFPTAAIVGGPAEVEYLQQTAPLYRRFGLRQPVLVPRVRSILVEPKVRRLLAQLGVSLDDACRLTRDELLRGSSPLPAPNEFRDRIAAAAGQLRRSVEDAGSGIESFVPSLARTFEKIDRALQGLTDQYQDAFHERDAIRLQRVDKLRGFILPGGEPQERALSAYWFLHAHGKALVDRLFAEPVPLDGEGDELVIDL